MLNRLGSAWVFKVGKFIYSAGLLFTIYTDTRLCWVLEIVGLISIFRTTLLLYSGFCKYNSSGFFPQYQSIDKLLMLLSCAKLVWYFALLCIPDMDWLTCWLAVHCGIVSHSSSRSMIC